MKHYTHLDIKDRCVITGLLSLSMSVDKIAQKSSRHRSTIYREIKRNKTKGGYSPGKANKMAEARHAHKPNKIDVNVDLNNFIKLKLKAFWSPEEISGYMKKYNMKFYSCPESIYRYIYRNKSLGLYLLLPRKQPKRFCRSLRSAYRKRPDLLIRNISHRNEEINLRKTFGHWEGDTIRFPRTQKGCVTTLVERKSRLVCLQKNNDKKSNTIIDPIVAKMKKVPKKVWASFTFDQGVEFMRFSKIERQSKCKVYFCDPHSPWQKGGNENMNGRLRRFW